jgi:NAD(P)-dependent dehydrogenase (short-subunit alcohol dehydrogenase family)
MSSQTVFIVGGANGIGKATVKLLCLKNHRLIVADRNQEKLKALAAEIPGETRQGMKFLTLDIADRDAVRSAVGDLRAQGARLDAVVISAGVHSTFPVEYLPDALINRVINVNLTAHIQLVRDVLPLVKDGGRMIALSSIAACVGVPMSSLYSASKSGLEGFYESLATEVAYRKIKTVLIHPGNVNTGFNETGNDYQPAGNTLIDEGYRRVVSRIDSRYGIDPAIVARVIERAIQDPSPRFCYVVGPNARKAHWAKRLLGRELAMKLMAKFFGF